MYSAIKVEPTLPLRYSHRWPVGPKRARQEERRESERAREEERETGRAREQERERESKRRGERVREQQQKREREKAREEERRERESKRREEKVGYSHLPRHLDQRFLAKSFSPFPFCTRLALRVPPERIICIYKK